MAVINANTLEQTSSSLGIFLHILPQIRVVIRARAIAELDTVTPTNDFAAKIRWRLRSSEILHWVCVPYPTIVNERQTAFRVAMGLCILGKSSKVCIDKRFTAKEAK